MSHGEHTWSKREKTSLLTLHDATLSCIGQEKLQVGETSIYLIVEDE